MKHSINLLSLLIAGLFFWQVSNAEIITYPWPAQSELYGNAKFEIRARTYNPLTKSYGDWMNLKEFYSFQRSYPNHWKVGDDAGTDFMSDRSLTFVSFAFTGLIEMEVTQKFSTQNAFSVEIAPKAFGFTPNYFNGKTVRFIMNSQEYVSVFFDFGSNDKTINRDDNRANGYDIRHGCMIFADEPEEALSDGYTIPLPDAPGVVVWDNETDLSVIRNANIIYFPPGEHIMRNHKDRWERNSSWEISEASGNWVTSTTEYNNAHLYRGRLNLGKNGQKVYLAPGAIVHGGFHSAGKDNNWLYGRGIVSGRKHLMHEIIKPAATIAETQAYVKVTQTKEAFCHFGNGAVYDGILFLEAWHHTCPSGKNSTIKRSKVIGWCSNNDGIRPASGSVVDKIFIKTSDDIDYARDAKVVKNSVFWPMVNGAMGMLGWSNLGSGYAEYYNIHVINSEWHLDNPSKGNIGIVGGGMADGGIKLNRNIYEDFHIENRTNYLVLVALSGNGTGYLRNFQLKNITTEYPFSNPAGSTVKQVLKGTDNTWIEDWTFTNVFVDGVLITWENHKNYFNLNLTGSNGSNTDATAKTKNITFNQEGSLREIGYTKTAGGTIRPKGLNSKIQIASGMKQTVSIQPDNGYRIKQITVDGNLQYEYGNNAYPRRQQSVVFNNISSDHSIDVVFEAGDDFFDLTGTFTSPPSVSFLLPEPELTLAPGNDIPTVAVNAESLDGNAITGVTLYINDLEVSLDSVAPYEWLSQDFTALQNLAAGEYLLRAQATTTANVSASALRLVQVIEPPSYIHIEAENYSAADPNIKKEATGDTGGGSNIGFIKHGSWSEYEISVPEAGTYEAIFRVASAMNGGTIRVMLGTDILAEVPVSVTGGWQSWTTSSAVNIQLPEGSQTIRLLYINPSATGTGFLFNVNWWQIDKTNDTGIGSGKPIKTIAVYPNPAKHWIALRAPEIYGNKTAFIYDLKGAFVTQRQISETGILKISDLQNGVYILRVPTARGILSAKVYKQ